jgi:hypothetical protein
MFLSYTCSSRKSIATTKIPTGMRSHSSPPRLQSLLRSRDFAQLFRYFQDSTLDGISDVQGGAAGSGGIRIPTVFTSSRFWQHYMMRGLATTGP